MCSGVLLHRTSDNCPTAYSTVPWEVVRRSSIPGAVLLDGIRTLILLPCPPLQLESSCYNSISVCWALYNKIHYSICFKGE